MPTVEITIKFETPETNKVKLGDYIKAHLSKSAIIQGVQIVEAIIEDGS